MAIVKSGMRSQEGFMLLEALIAILIFSVGILAIIGMQAAAVNAVGDAKYRSDAAILVNELIGRMWASDRTTATLQANFNSPSGASYTSWLASVQTTLPGVSSGSAPSPTVAIDATGTATITVYWKAPNEPTTNPAHNHIVIAQVR